jgi:hypothetical protein
MVVLFSHLTQIKEIEVRLMQENQILTCTGENAADPYRTHDGEKARLEGIAKVLFSNYLTRPWPRTPRQSPSGRPAGGLSRRAGYEGSPGP